MKAYGINFNKIHEGYCYDSGSFIAHAETKGKAKSKLLEAVKYESVYLQGSGDEVTFTTIPVIRMPEYDKEMYEGELLTKIEIKQAERKKKRANELSEMLANGGYAYIMKRGLYYRPDSCGYTEYKKNAGVYTIEDAVSDAKSCEDLTIKPINIEEHNTMLLKRIEDLKTRIIK